MVFTEFNTFAKIEKTSRGYRRLFLDGYSYGEAYKHPDRITWRCTGTHNIIDSHKKSRQRCNALLVTEIINGYEMIKNTKVVHNH